jgi:Ni/Fe-hydrogenase subunit HybB-like protein
MGYAMVVCESALAAAAFKRAPETRMLASLAGAIVPLQFAFVALRVGDLWWRGRLSLLLAGDGRSVLAAFEIALFLAPVVMLASAGRRENLGHLFRAALMMMCAGALYRFDTYLVAFQPGAHWSYFPSVSELAITVGLVAAEILAYLAIVKTFPILAGSPRLAERAV